MSIVKLTYAEIEETVRALRQICRNPVPFAFAVWCNQTIDDLQVYVDRLKVASTPSESVQKVLKDVAAIATKHGNREGSHVCIPPETMQAYREELADYMRQNEQSIAEARYHHDALDLVRGATVEYPIRKLNLPDIPHVSAKQARCIARLLAAQIIENQ